MVLCFLVVLFGKETSPTGREIINKNNSDNNDNNNDNKGDNANDNNNNDNNNNNNNNGGASDLKHL